MNQSENANLASILPPLLGLTLMDVKIELFGQGYKTDGAPSFEFDLQIDTPTGTDHFTTFEIEASIYRFFPDDEGRDTVISANYYAALDYKDRADKSDTVEHAKWYAQTTAWGLFTSLASVLVQQTGIPFPQLPASPGDVTVKKREEEVGS